MVDAGGLAVVVGALDVVFVVAAGLEVVVGLAVVVAAGVVRVRVFVVVTPLPELRMMLLVVMVVATVRVVEVVFQVVDEDVTVRTGLRGAEVDVVLIGERPRLSARVY